MVTRWDPVLLIDLGDVEGTPFAQFCLSVTDTRDGSFLGKPFPAGVTGSADRRAYGADVHLSWEQARRLRDTLTTLLHEAGQE